MARTIDTRTLRRMAGARSFERGEAYVAEGRVGDLVEHEGRITARVAGTDTYRVALRSRHRDPDYSCTCPVGRDGAFCKHCVAVGLAWLNQRRTRPRQSRNAPRAVTMDQMRAHLQTWEHERLVDLLIELAVDDDDLRRRLVMEAAKGASGGVDLVACRAAIDSAVDAGRFVDYHGAYAYAQGIHRAIEALDDLLKDGHAAEVINLAEHALAAVERAMGSVDDSDGEMGGLLERLQALHVKACRKAKPDPEHLAARLFAWELRTDWDTFSGAAATYADVLGTKGLAVYRRLAEARWAKVPALGPGREDANRYGSRFRLTHIMETLAERTGDVEVLVEVLKRDLSVPYSFLRIAEAYQRGGRREAAVTWAERGLTAFPGRPDSRLRAFLAREYQSAGRHDDAIALMWAEFADDPTLAQYQELKRHAARVQAWPGWREKALALLREKAAKTRAAARRVGWGLESPREGSELVRIFLWEKDTEGAWREAQLAGCSSDLWMALAATREKMHPADAVSVYEARMEPTLQEKNNDAYREAVRLLRKIRLLMRRLGREADFASYLASLRVAHKPKRNFIAMLDRATWD
jgi:uncharacterized Zn finger protein